MSFNRNGAVLSALPGALRSASTSKGSEGSQLLTISQSGLASFEIVQPIADHLSGLGIDEVVAGALNRNPLFTEALVYINAYLPPEVRGTEWMFSGAKDCAQFILLKRLLTFDFKLILGTVENLGHAKLMSAILFGQRIYVDPWIRWSASLNPATRDGVFSCLNDAIAECLRFSRILNASVTEAEDTWFERIQAMASSQAGSIEINWKEMSESSGMLFASVMGEMIGFLASQSINSSRQQSDQDDREGDVNSE